jgi:Mg2+/citrate symporter
MAKSFKLQLVETFATLMTAAFGMIAALAWNGAIKAAVGVFFGDPDDLTGMFVYAIIITVLAVICIILIARSLGNLKEAYEAEEEAKKK